MTTGFYFNPGDRAPRDFAAWKAGMDQLHSAISRVAQENDLGIYLTGDDIARTKNELFDSVCDSPDPAVCPQPTSQAKIRYALDWAKNSRRVIGIE
ncbi:hypothetical protein FHS29_005543 [Saccharothrix tamanrassetensis]|uniref:Uncharacterized protein n=2 Tax=Saccharothrix tamanrassetensis TaxID=1051531 RepID=A0A841CRF1_9PSEU|nr:hypothetical protein [Saccharothrix tamanrassetensis]